MLSLLYYHFDFHARVHGISQASFDQELDSLVEELAPFIDECNFLDAVAESPSPPPSDAQPPRRWQAGVLRTNCLDCLDRTNVVQFYMTWAWLRKWCLRFKFLHSLLELGPPLDDGHQDALSHFQHAGSK